MINRGNFSQVRDLYVIFSQSYFIPTIQENDTAYSEPFKSFISKFLYEIKQHRKTLPLYLFSEDTPFWEKHIFIPNVGQLTFNHRKNIVSRFLLGPIVDYEFADIEWEKMCDYNCTFPSSRHLFTIPHLPFLIKYNKKIKPIPTISDFLKFKNRHFVHASQSNRVYIHFYPYGLFVLNLAVSISSAGLNTSELIEWLRRVKNNRISRDEQILFQVRNVFKGNLTELFQYLWGNVARSVLSNDDLVIKSPIYDSIRVKPINKLNSEIVQQSATKVLQSQDGWKFSSWNGEFWPSFVDLLMESHRRELTVQDYRSLCITPAKHSSHLTSELRRYEWSFLMNFHDFRRDLDGSGYFEGDLEQMYSQYVLISHFLHTQNEYWGEFFISFLHKKLKDSILRIVREKFPITLTQNEIAGLLSKSQNWTKFNTEIPKYESVFGRFKGDTIIPKTQSLLIMHNNWSTRKQLSLLFQWQLQAVHELVSTQRLIIPYYSELIKSETQQTINFLAETKKQGEHEGKSIMQKSTLLFLTDLTNLQIHFPPHFRKWYYQLAQAMGVTRMLGDFSQAIDSYLETMIKDRHISTHIEYVVNLQKAVIDSLQIGDGNVTQIRRDSICG